MALVDDSPTVRLMAQTLITDVLSNVPTLAHNHFLEVMFLVNGSAAAWRASRRAGDPQDTLLNVTDFSPVSQASLSGPTEEARGRRFSIYKVCESDTQAKDHRPRPSFLMFSAQCHEWGTIYLGDDKSVAVCYRMPCNDWKLIMHARVVHSLDELLRVASRSKSWMQWVQ